MPVRRVSRNFVDALVAVLAGNLIYYWLMPYLPVRARHVAFQQDWGILVDFWFCLVAYGIVKAVRNWRTKRQDSTQ
jgi:hypothetical protein